MVQVNKQEESEAKKKDNIFSFFHQTPAAKNKPENQPENKKQEENNWEVWKQFPPFP